MAMIDSRRNRVAGPSAAGLARSLTLLISFALLGGFAQASGGGAAAPVGGREASVAPCMVALAETGAPAKGDAGAACGASARPFVGEAVETPRNVDARFMMVSAWHLEPYSHEYLENVLTDLARHRVSGIVYGTLGATTSLLRSRGSPLDEETLNRSIYQMAHDYGANVWLQLRVYDNQMEIGGAAPRNYTADELLNMPGGKEAYADGVRRDFLLYNQYFKENCAVIMFEEAGIYHAPAGAGSFWSGQQQRVGRPNRETDEIFATRLAGLFQIAERTIKSINPSCKVGFHIGHLALDDHPVMQEWMDRLAAAQAAPDFIFYDLYLKSQPDFSTYAAHLEERANFIMGTLRIPAMHLAQLQTMNNFQRGLGATPSRDEIDAMVALDLRLGFKGIGFYSKNAVPTSRFDNGPMEPNAVGQATVYESSKDRWDYGLLKVFEAGGADFRNLFDLVVRQQGSSRVEISARNIATGAWDLIGVIPASGASGGQPPAVTVFRALDAHRYLDAMRRLTLRFAASPAGRTNEAVWVVPSQPSRAFISAEAERTEITSADRPGDTRGSGAIDLGGGDGTLTFCLQ